MSQARLASDLPSPSTWHMYRAMVGIGLLCGLLIVSVFEFTRPIIERNRAEALQRAIFQVLPQARSSTTFRLIADDHFEVHDGTKTDDPLVYAGYDEQGRLVGLAIEAAGMGYQDVITVLYGYSFSEDAIVGLRVLESKETPGLGDKIEADPEFLENFKHLDVSLTEDRSRVANPIVKVKHGEKEHPWQVDAITGATISSTAIANLLSRSTVYWVPRIVGRLEDFQNAKDRGESKSVAEGGAGDPRD